MNKWLGRVAGVLGMALTWAVGWAFVGLLIGVSSLLLPGLPWERFFAIFDAPLPALAVPGFVGGAIFGLLLALVERRRRFEQLSLPRFVAWGALGGGLLSLVPAAFVLFGAARLGRPGLDLWQLTSVISAPLIVLSALSASAALVLARLARPWRSLLLPLLAGERGPAR